MMLSAYAMPGTRWYKPTRVLCGVRYWPSVCCYARSGTDRACAATSRARECVAVMEGAERVLGCTDLRYGGRAFTAYDAMECSVALVTSRSDVTFVSTNVGDKAVE
eukprot:2132008-Rhodomonas_salina.1